ncbi:hypothetical protein C8Q79DRAFT_912872 [Trametes meyenii]|nr:hypothetical protein C8Q79DRAFT_912872 [Trametes meyenii]
MENTFTQTFCMTNNLKAIVHGASFPEILQPLIPLIERAFSGQVSSLLTDLGLTSGRPIPEDPGHLVQLPNEVYNSLFQRLSTDVLLSEGTSYRHARASLSPADFVLNPSARQLDAIVHRGRRYADVTHRIGDSQVVFRRGTTTRFGQIQSIFLHHRRLWSGDFRYQVFIALREHEALSPQDVTHDNYRKHEGLEAQLVRSTLDPAVLVIPIQDIVCHFASCPLPEPDTSSIPYPCLVVISLNEVRTHVTPPTQADRSST